MTARSIAAAECLLSARMRRRTTASLPAELRPRSVADAYAIQDAVVDGTGAVGGWKVGAKSPTAEPTCSPLCAAWIVNSPAAFDADRFARHGIEAELAFTLACDLPRSRGEYGERDVASAIATVHAAIEVVDSRFADMAGVDALSQLADSLSHGALVVGPGIALPATFDLARQAVELRFDDAPEYSGMNSNPAGHPFRLLAWLANHAAGRRGGLRRGDVVTTGSWSGLRFAGPRASVWASFRGVGGVAASFA